MSKLRLALTASLVLAAAVPAFAENYAVVVGIESYPDFNTVKYATQDARAFRNALISNRLVNADHIYCAITGSDVPPNRLNLLKLVRNLNGRLSRRDTLFFFYSGHGCVRNVGPTSVQYLIPEDGSSDYIEDSCVPFGEIERSLYQANAGRCFVFIDACRSRTENKGAGGTNTSLFAYTPTIEGTCIMLSCKEGQSSYWSDLRKMGIFTYCLVKGLDGGASDSAGAVTMNSLSSYLGKSVPRECQRANRKVQTPWMAGEGSIEMGNLVIARHQVRKAMGAGRVTRKELVVQLATVYLAAEGKTLGGIDSALDLSAGKPMFEDLRRSDRSTRNAVWVLSSQGLMEGDLDGMAHLEKSVTRAEAAMLVARVLSKSNQALHRRGPRYLQIEFSDVGPDAYYRDAASMCVYLGIIRAKEGNRFCGKDILTSDELSKITSFLGPLVKML